MELPARGIRINECHEPRRGALTRRKPADLLDFLQEPFRFSERKELRMSFHAKKYVGGLAVVLFALPVWATSSRTDSVPFDTAHGVVIGQTQLQPGDYTLKAKETENQLDILKGDKVIATVPCTWVKLPRKAADTEVMADQNHVVEVEFRGRTEAVKIG